MDPGPITAYAGGWSCLGSRTCARSPTAPATIYAHSTPRDRSTSQVPAAGRLDRHRVRRRGAPGAGRHQPRRQHRCPHSIRCRGPHRRRRLGRSGRPRDRRPGSRHDHRSGEPGFDRFYRADRSPDRSGGTNAGLGLAIARSLTEAHGGAVELETALGQGACFRLTLPLLAGG
ncbi:ATP-binding protein [Kribbella sp. CA-245084]|uniref:ATP-binding protein n=1 Tax=Kribbella sp. CA-245084 TaxID=3239940 RepID=UPI003D8FC450